MSAALDFSPLSGPLDAGEARARRRSLLGGRSIVREYGLLRWFGLVSMGLVWPVVILVVAVVVVTSIEWLAVHGPVGVYQLSATIVLGACAILVALCVIATRFLIIRPAWGRWVRLQRFAEVNDLVFIRTARAGELPSAVADVGADVALLSDAFVDPISGVVVGNAGAGFGRQGFVARTGAVEPDVDPLAPGEQPLRGFDLVQTGTRVLALRHRSVRMLHTPTIRRMFATADAVRRGDQDAIR